MTDEEYIRSLEGIDLRKSEIDELLDIVGKLKAENEELKAQLEQATKLPCKVGDILFTVTFTLNDGCDEAGVLHTAGWQISETVVTEKNLYRMCELVQKHKAFTVRGAAENRLEELQNATQS